jgi:hypothetical protein
VDNVGERGGTESFLSFLVSVRDEGVYDIGANSARSG